MWSLATLRSLKDPIERCAAWGNLHGLSWPGRAQPYRLLFMTKGPVLPPNSLPFAGEIRN